MPEISMHPKCKVHKNIIMINRDHVIWFICVKTQNLSSVTGWNYEKFTEVINSYIINLNFLIVGSLHKSSQASA